MEAAVEAGEPGVAPLKRPAVEAQRIAPGLTLAVEAHKERAAGTVAEFGGPALAEASGFFGGTRFFPRLLAQPRRLSLVLRRRCPSTKASTSRLR